MAGKIQNADVKSLAEVGSVKSRLAHDSKTYVNSYSLDKLLSEAITDFDLGNGDSPLRMYANPAGADSKLYFKGNTRQLIDGTSKTTTPIDDNSGAFLDNNIDVQTGVVTGGGSFTYQGVAFSLPSTAFGFHRRFVFALQGDGSVAVNYSSPAATVGALPTIASLMSALEGTGIGYCDLEQTTAVSGVTFKTSGSATNIVENKVGGVSRIVWFGGGGGGSSGGAVSDLKAQSIAANVLTIKKGFLKDSSGRLIGLESDLSLNLLTGVNTQGVISPAASTVYWLYVDTAFLPITTTVATNIDFAGLSYYALAAGTSGPFVISATVPEQKDLSRYYPLAFLKTNGSSNYTLKKDYPVKHAGVPSVNVSPLVYEDPDHSIGTVGSAGQLATYGALVAGDFPGAGSLSSFYGLNANGTDASANARTFSSSGSPGFTAVGFYGNESTLQILATADKLQRTGDTFFNINLASGAFTYGAWFYVADWSSVAVGKAFMAQSSATAGTLIQMGGAGLRFTDSTGTIFAATPQNSLSPGWHHVVGVINAGTLSLYFDGQLAGSTAGATGTGTGSDGYIGNNSGSNGYLGLVVQQAFFTNQVLTASQINLIYSKRFKGQQLAGGHVLAANSFPLASLSGKAAFYNLTGLTDGSVNAKNLTDEGTVAYTALDIVGAASCPRFNGTTQSLKSTDSFFNLSSKVFAFGGWFAADSWSPSGRQFLIALTDGNTERLGIDLGYPSAGFLSLDMDGFSNNVAIPISFSGGSWHHIAVTVFNGEGRLYVDGILAATKTQTTATLASPVFRISGKGTTLGNPFAGRSDEVFFIKDVQLTDADIQKLVAASITTGVTQAVSDQDWKATFISEDGQITNEMSDSFLVDKKPTTAWVHFGPGGSAARVNLRMNQT